ncbi:MAG: hypothetical protein JSV91_01210 [Phycisphaerales bacterium]|nr:MAG: hypothetical protein JSV91_01210 [Phycisphaerales bacterium]
MSDSRALWERLNKGRLIALLSPRTPADCVLAYEALEPLGVVLEIALRTDCALDGVAALCARHPEALVLAGTVITPAQAQAAIDAGASGIVSPDYFPAVVELCAGRDLMCVPGGLADAGKQLAQKARLYDCEPDELRRRHPYQWVYKLFPALAGNVSNVEIATAWKAVFKDLTVIYTGGLTAENLHRILPQDPHGMVCGSALTRHLPDAERTAAEAKRWLELIHPPSPSEPLTKKRTRRKFPPDQTARVLTFGELMLRLAPPHGLRFIQASSLESTFGGSEANVAVTLAQWGLISRFISALPPHAIGQAAIDSLRSRGVDTNHVLRCGERIGVYYLEHGASQRPSKVIYDRAGSSMSQVQPGQINWNDVMEGAAWFHVSGITPALGPSTAAVTFEAIRAAHEAGATISLDINYRSKLWSPQEACAALTPMMQYVDVVTGNEEDAANVFGIRAVGADVAAGRLDEKAYAEVARQLVERFDLDLAALTLRESLTASDNIWSACLHDGQRYHHSRRYEIHVVDRVGGGDAFSAGLIFGLISGKAPQETLEFATAASCLKQTIHGDFALVSPGEVQMLAAGDASGRIRR